jgi:hypothetical protein
MSLEKKNTWQIRSSNVKRNQITKPKVEKHSRKIWVNSQLDSAVRLKVMIVVVKLDSWKHYDKI